MQTINERFSPVSDEGEARRKSGILSVGYPRHWITGRITVGIGLAFLFFVLMQTRFSYSQSAITAVALLVFFLSSDLFPFLLFPRRYPRRIEVFEDHVLLFGPQMRIELERSRISCDRVSRVLVIMDEKCTFVIRAEVSEFEKLVTLLTGVSAEDSKKE